MSKRQPLLADRFMRLHDSALIERDTVDRVRNRLQKATHRFVFDDKATKRTGEVIRDIPDLLFRESQLARAPYDLTYIEVPNFPLLWETITGNESDSECDAAVGFLIDHGCVYVLSGGTKSSPSLPPQLLPTSYLLNTPWEDDARKAFAKTANATLLEIDGFGWGSIFNGITAQEAEDPNHPIASLRNAHSCRWLPLKPQFTNQKNMRRFVVGAAGELRNLVAMLLLLNRPSLTTYVEDVPRSRGFIRGKEMPYFSHTVVSIDLDPIPTLRKIGTSEGETVSRRRHEARGTWCHNEEAREYAKIGCVHEWHPDPKHIGQDDPKDPDHFACDVCDGKVWWRRQSVRGDSKKGFVHKDEYNVSMRTEQARRNI